MTVLHALSKIRTDPTTAMSAPSLTMCAAPMPVRPLTKYVLSKEGNICTIADDLVSVRVERLEGHDNCSGWSRCVV